MSLTRSSKRKINRNLLRVLLTGMTAVVLFSGSSSAQTITNDLSATSPAHYDISGDDPYIIFNPVQQAEKPRYLSIDLGSQLTDVPLEIFFNSEQDLFNPYYKISFTVSSFPAALELPAGTAFTQSTRLRLDINQCESCSLNFENLPVLTDQIDATVTLIEPKRVQIGIVALDKNSATIINPDWHFNDLNGALDKFEMSADDPFIVSTQLSLATEHLAGVYFKLKAPKSNHAWNSYQLFYQTERHSFSRQASSTLRIADSDNGIVEFMFPLDFLSTQQPSNIILERIRLDIPEISGYWTLLEARLVHKENVADYLRMIPVQLIQSKQQVVTGRSLIKQSLINVSADIGFSISYLLLMLSVTWIVVRGYRSSR
jgi:hypothetical protein